MKVKYNTQKGSGVARVILSTVLLTMTPVMLNSSRPVKYLPMNDHELTEVAAQIPTEDVATIDFAQVQQAKPKQILPGIIDSTSIQFKKTYKMEGKNYTLYFIDSAKEVRPKKNIVTDIFLIPEDFSYIHKSGEARNYPPMLEKFIYHDLGDPENKDYCSALLHEQRCDKNGENSEFIYREVRLPDDVANDIIGLANGDLGLLMLDRMASMFSTVKH
ncbi:MAG: hypothetical protein IJ166_06430 [Prevotella sp.]|nr:hypothetical protein [Prevotella sp.]